MKGKVFIIDDDTTILEGMKRCLELEGYEVGIASSAMTAAFLLRRFDPDVILLDLNMPALGGERLLSLDRKWTFPPASQVILWSGRSEAELAAFAERVGADGFHSKGDDLDRFLVKLQRWVARAETKRGGAAPVSISEKTVLLRTGAEPRTATADDLRAGGYAVVEAFSDDEVVERLKSIAPDALVIETSFYGAIRLLPAIETSIPVFVLSVLGDQIRRRFPFIRPLGPRLERYDLIAAIDRVLVDGSRLAVQ